jgi:hypothetical protein
VAAQRKWAAGGRENILPHRLEKPVLVLLDHRTKCVTPLRLARSVDFVLFVDDGRRKILRPLDAARRFTPASFAFLQSRHHIMYRHRDVWSVPDLNNRESEDAPIEIAPRPPPPARAIELRTPAYRRLEA